MRIALVTRGDLFPTNHGAAVKIVRTAEALSRAGAPTCVVTENRDHYLRFVEGQHQEIPYSPRFRAAEEWPVIPALGHQAERLCARLGYPREEIFLYRPMFDPAWWGRAAEVGRKEGIDVFQAEFPGYGVPAVVAAQGLGLLRRLASGSAARPITSIVQHNVEWDRLAEFGYPVARLRRVEQALLRAVDEVIAVSADDRRRMVAAGLDPAKTTVIPHGVDVGIFQAAAARASSHRAELAARYGLPLGVPWLFFHGTLHYWPNTEAVRFIAEELLPRVLPQVPDLRVIIAGQSPPTYYAHPAIHFTGSVDDLAAHVAAADLCLCPIQAGGGTRMKLLEYMAAGKATVSTTKGAEGIPHGDALIIADGPEPFASAVLAALASPEERHAVGARAAAFSARYAWESIGAAYLSVYRGEGRGEDWNQRLLAGPPPPVLRPLDAHLPPRTPSKPLTLLLLLNRGCNLRCVFCDLWEDHIHMPVAERLLPLLDEAVAIGTRTLVLTGGEPFLHPDLFLAVREARARGLAVNITTNGTRIDKRWEELLASGVNSLSFSLDGLEATHDRLRGQPGAWRKTVAGLTRVLEHGGIGASVYFVVTRDNVAELPALYDQVRALGADFDFWPVNDAPDLELKTEEDQALFRAAVAHIAAHDPAVAARAGYYEEGLAYHAGRRGPVRCLGFLDQYGVTYDGRLLPCCVWGGEGLSVGNVFERPLRELWTSPEVQGFREQMFHAGCEVGCFNHSLYEFSTSTGLPFRVDAGAAG